MAQTINTDEGAVIPIWPSQAGPITLYVQRSFDCGVPFSLRSGMVAASRLFDGTIMPAQPGRPFGNASDAACERSDFTKNKPKSSGHGMEFGSA